jgi:hypothetical protein
MPETNEMKVAYETHKPMKSSYLANQRRMQETNEMTVA